MNADTLLTEIAIELWEQAEKHARPVIETGRQDAANDPFIGAFAFAQYQQGARTPDLFHLPEPILQPVDKPRVLVVSVNPGYGKGEHMPTLGWLHQDYARFYRERFEERGRIDGYPAIERDAAHGGVEMHKIKHLTIVETVLASAIGPQALGRNAVFCDAIRWKWSKFENERFREPQLTVAQWADVWRRIAQERVGRIARALDPEVVLILGELNRWLYDLKVHYGPYVGTRQISDWRGTVVSSGHPNGSLKRTSYRAALSESLSRVLP